MNSQLDQLSTDGSRFRVMLGEPISFFSTPQSAFVNCFFRPQLVNWPQFRAVCVSPFRLESSLNRQLLASASLPEAVFSRLWPESRN
jgi:hypothetical protein